MNQLLEYQVKTREDWIDQCIEGVTEQSSTVRKLSGLTPLVFSLVVASRGIGIATQSLREAGLIKRSYHKRNKKYWGKI